MTDRYAHIEYKPTETVHRVISNHDLVATQREPVQSYLLQPGKPTLGTSDPRPSYQHSQSWPRAATTDEKPYQLQLEVISEVSKPKMSYQRSKTVSSLTRDTEKSHLTEPEQTSAMPVSKSEPSLQLSKTPKRYTRKPHTTQPEQTCESKPFRRRSKTLDLTTRHDISKSTVTEQPKRSKSPKRPQSVSPYWMTGNESSVAMPVNSGDDTDGELEKRADLERSFPTDQEGYQHVHIPTESPTSDAVAHTVGDESQPPRVPILQFSLQHDSDDNTLTVHLIQAEHLPVKDIGGASDPFVKLSLESNACECFESKVIRRTLNHRFNQHFKFTNLPSKIHLEKLVFEIYDYDRLSLNDFIGEVRVLLRKELLNGDTITMRVDELARELRV